MGIEFGRSSGDEPSRPERRRTEHNGEEPDAQRHDHPPNCDGPNRSADAPEGVDQADASDRADLRDRFKSEGDPLAEELANLAHTPESARAFDKLLEAYRTGDERLREEAFDKLTAAADATRTREATGETDTDDRQRDQQPPTSEINGQAPAEPGLETLAQPREIPATKAALDAAYATGDKDTITATLRDALATLEGHPEPERHATWQTIAEEMGGKAHSFPNYETVKRVLGTAPGTEIHHVVEQCQANPERSGFDPSRINSTDNLTRIPTDIHRQVSAEYSTKAPFAGETLRDQLNGAPWDEQYEVGVDILNKVFKEKRNDDD